MFHVDQFNALALLAQKLVVFFRADQWQEDQAGKDERTARQYEGHGVSFEAVFEET